MPTRGRQQWAREAVAMFERQTWPNKELVVIDDRNEPSFPLGLPGHSHHIAGRVTVGAKRNIAVSRARGDILIHWDSDDIYTDDRMEDQVQLLLANAEMDLVGYNIMPFIDVERNEQYQYVGPMGYCIGVSMCYWRATWEQKPFDQIDQGEDSNFLGARRALSVDSEGRIIARIHNGNTCDKRATIPQDSMRWRLTG